MWIMRLLNDLIILSLSAGIASLLFAVYELAAVMRMTEWVYRTGWTPVNLTEDVTLRAEDAGRFDTRAAGRCKYRFASANTCLFRERLQPSHLLRIQGAMPMKGEIVFLGDKARIKGRAPLGLTGFHVALILGAVSIEAKVILQASGYVSPVVLGAGILAVVATMYAVLAGEKESFMAAYQDLRDSFKGEESRS